MIKHLCSTFRFNTGKDSICTICKTDDCDNYTLWLKSSGKRPERFFVKDPSEIRPYTGDSKRFAGSSKSDHRGPYGRIVDIVAFAESGRIINIDYLREEAFRYISGVDSCQGFNRYGKADDSQIATGPHSIQNKVMDMGLFDEAVKDTRVLSSPDEEIKTAYRGRKSYTDD